MRNVGALALRAIFLLPATLRCGPAAALEDPVESLPVSALAELMFAKIATPTPSAAAKTPTLPICRP
jgi:hypothetical protein